jgi:hypothetical protein
MSADLVCRDERRRQHIREHPPANGLDYVDVHGRLLCVHFLTGIPDVFPNDMTEDQRKAAARHIVIKGGRRITNIEVISVDAHATADVFDEDCLQLEVDRAGDFSVYTLCFVELDAYGHPTNEPLHGLDPRYACIEFSFKIDCAAEIDCKQDDACPAPAPRPRTINYLAKDYATFRQLLLDRLSLTMPDWRERHVPDLGITLVELLAYAGDYLSYYQDAVASEAYLDTARRRISVRRHVRLVDYAMHEGCNARVFVHLQAAADTDLDARNFFVITRPRTGTPPARLREEDLASLADGWLAFEPVAVEDGGAIRVRKAHNTIAIYTWGSEECCLAKGATRATLVDDGLELRAGDLLLFEELACAGTVSRDNFDGNTPMPDADPSHRHVVRLTAVRETNDPLFYDRALLEVEWSREAALPFTLCVSAVGKPPECDQVNGLAVARGNIVLADQGHTRFDEVLPPVPELPSPEVCEGEDDLSEIARIAGRYRPMLRFAPLTFAQPVSNEASASRMLRQDPRAALPAVKLAAIPPSFRGDVSLFPAEALRDPRPLALLLAKPTDAALISLRNRLRPAVIALLETKANDNPELVSALRENLRLLLDAWTARADLLDSGRDDAELVAEIDDEGHAHLRFGDGEDGRAVDTGTTFLATYRAGNGRMGLIGAETIAHVVFRHGFTNALDGVRNPLAAAGAVDPEPVEEVRMLAPHAFRKDLQRAVVGGDYAQLAQYTRFPERNPAVQSAAANLQWSGSWYEANVGIDPFGTESLSDPLRESVTGLLHRYRRMGHDLRVGPATYVPLLVQLTLCIDPHFLRAPVVKDVMTALRRFFDPDNLTFSGVVYGSRIVALVQSIEGVAEVHLERLERLDARTVDVAPAAAPAAFAPALALGPSEVARLDNDPVNPENGLLRITARGGR